MIKPEKMCLKVEKSTIVHSSEHGGQFPIFGRRSTQKFQKIDPLGTFQSLNTKNEKFEENAVKGCRQFYQL